MTTIILDDIKQSLGIDLNEYAFDLEVLEKINSAWSEIVLMGFTPDPELIIIDDTAWPDFPSVLLESMIKTVVILKVRAVFSPTASATIEGTYERTLERLAFRVGVELARLAELEEV